MYNNNIILHTHTHILLKRIYTIANDWMQPEWINSLKKNTSWGGWKQYATVCPCVWEGWGIKAEPGRQKSSLSHIVSEITNIAALDNSKLRRWSAYRRYFLPLTLCSAVILNHSCPIPLFLCFLQFSLLWSTPPTSTIISIHFSKFFFLMLVLLSCFPPLLSFPLFIFTSSF